jgi:hypothetical protein
VADTPRRGKPYVWVTWVTGLLSGQDRCFWRAWYKAHFKYDKREETEERRQFLDEWTVKHDSMVRDRAEQLQADGYVTKDEDASKFQIEGVNAIMAGKPDLVGIKDGTALVFDQKSGKKRDSDRWQVWLYLLALPLSWLKGMRIRGFVEYRDGSVEVPPLTDAQTSRIKYVMGIIGGSNEPERVPSANECKFCDIACCPDRIESKAHEGDASKFF